MAQEQTVQTEILVIGSGASGLTTALTASLKGAKVMVVEKEARFGGTTAWSGGMIWIPLNGHQKKAGVSDSEESARDYIRLNAGNAYDETRVNAFLRNGPAMLDFLERNSEVKFYLPGGNPDYRPSVAGSVVTGRAMVPEPYDGRGLGPDLKNLQPPPRERTLFLGMQISGADMAHFLKWKNSLQSAFYVAGRIARNLLDVAVHGRAMLTFNGNALIARLARSLLDRKVPIWLSTSAKELISSNGRIVGAIVDRGGETIRIEASRGVVLACGGFSHDYVRRERVYPHHPKQDQVLSAAPPFITGDGVTLAETVGGAFEDRYANSGAWFPMSHVKHADGSEGNYAHLLERGKPGYIAVTPEGKRFADEAQNYHDLVRELFATRTEGRDIHAFFLCDTKAFNKFGLGMAKPWPIPHGHYIRSGYLKTGGTIEELARNAGLPPDVLAATVATYNKHAAEGQDPEFHKGENVYDRGQGDPSNTPNPCVAPLLTPPFYAVRFMPGDLGTFAGLRTDEHARVLTGDRTPIPGLYAVGNDQASVFGGAYPGAGATIGPGMTFGYVAALHMMQAGNPA